MVLRLLQAVLLVYLLTLATAAASTGGAGLLSHGGGRGIDGERACPSSCNFGAVAAEDEPVHNTRFFSVAGPVGAVFPIGSTFAGSVLISCITVGDRDRSSFSFFMRWPGRKTGSTFIGSVFYFCLAIGERGHWSFSLFAGGPGCKASSTSISSGSVSGFAMADRGGSTRCCASIPA